MCHLATLQVVQCATWSPRCWLTTWPTCCHIISNVRPLCYRSNVQHSHPAPLPLVQCATLLATQLWVPHGYEGTAYRSNFSASLLYGTVVPMCYSNWQVAIVLKCHLAPCLAILLLVYIYCPFCTQHCFDGFRKILVKCSTGTLLLTFVKRIDVPLSFNILSFFNFRSYEIIIFRLKYSPANKVIHRALALPVVLSLQVWTLWCKLLN